MQGCRPVIGITTDHDGEYLKLKRAYSVAVLRAGGIPVILPPSGDARFFVAVINGLLIPGGGDLDPSYYSEEPGPDVKSVPREKTDFEIALLKAIIETGKPAFGICYGMQLMNVALGGSLYQDIAYRTGTSLDHTKGMHGVRGDDEGMRGNFMVNTSHHQAVKETGRDIRVIAVAEDGLVEAIRLAGYPFLLGVQWHPERSMDELSDHLMRSFVEAAHGCK